MSRELGSLRAAATIDNRDTAVPEADPGLFGPRVVQGQAKALLRRTLSNDHLSCEERLRSSLEHICHRMRQALHSGCPVGLPAHYCDFCRIEFGQDGGRMRGQNELAHRSPLALGWTATEDAQ